MDHHADISNQTLNMKIRNNNNPKKTILRYMRYREGVDEKQELIFWEFVRDIYAICWFD